MVPWTAYSFINSCFDFEFEDQPETVAEYAGTIDYMWARGAELGLTAQMEQALRYLVTRDDPATELDSFFLPGKHDLKEVLQLALARQPHPR